MTHSIEVSVHGRTIANSITYELMKKRIIDPSLALQIISVVENACLLHDIGNPPFGHFGETAIKDWMIKNLENYSKEAGVCFDEFEKYASDFYEFDGNPQGLRVVTRLHCERNESGLNLSYPTLLKKEKPMTKI